MSALPKLIVDGAEIAPFKWSRAVARRSPSRKYLAETLRRHRRAKSSGVLVAMMNLGFAPTLTLFVAAATTSTTTVPSGATTVEIQAWGGGGDGGNNQSGTLQHGGGGGGGAYSRCSLACGTANGQTLVVTCTQTALAEQTCPGYTVKSGSFAISTVTAGCGTGGNHGIDGGAAGTGGAASNANSGAVNTPGNNGTNGGAGTHGHGGAGISGNVAGDGSPYGTGAGAPGAGAAQLGAVVLYYT
jgi:hypothetical protein